MTHAGVRQTDDRALQLPKTRAASMEPLVFATHIHNEELVVRIILVH
jgi:hypothetical protein